MLQIVGSHKRQFHLASLLSIFGQILDLVPALLIGWMAVVLITGKSAALVRLGLGSASSQLWFLAGATALVGVLIAALSFLADTLWRKLAQSVQHEWRTKVYAHLQRVKLRHLEAADTSYTLNVKCLLAGISSFAELVDELAEGRVTRRAQDPGGRTYHARTARPPAALTISWRHSAQEIDAAVRASDFGPHPNEFGTVKLWCPTGFVIVRAAEVCAEASTAPAGTVVSTSAAGMRVAPISHDIRLTQLTTLAGAALTPHALGLCPGYRLPELDSAQAETLTRAYREALWHEPYWVEQLSGLVPLELPARERSTAAAGRRMLPVKVPVAYPAEALLAATLAFLDRVTGAAEAGVGLRWHREPVADAQLFASTLPVRVLTAAGNFTAYRAEVGRRVREVAEHGTYTRDLVIRYPRLHDKHWIDQGLPITVELVDDLDLPAVPDPATALLVRTSRDGECRWLIADPVLSGQTGAQLRDAFVTFLHGLDDQDLERVPLLPAGRRHLLAAWNDTARPVAPACLPTLFETQVAATPQAVAVIFDDVTLTYAQLNAQANGLTHALTAQGVGPEQIVGLALPRAPELVVAILAVLKAGAADLPLDLATSLEIMANNTRLGIAFTPSRFQGVLLLFNSTIDRPEDGLTPEAWRPYVDGEIEVFDITGQHNRMMTEGGSLAQIGPILAAKLQHTTSPSHREDATP